jgi:hypothetical protein
LNKFSRKFSKKKKVKSYQSKKRSSIEQSAIDGFGSEMAKLFYCSSQATPSVKVASERK